MTRGTTGILVFATQFKFGFAIVIEGALFPALVAVAVFALVAILALVHVIKLVTAHAGGLEFDFLRVFLVASGAPQAGMFVM